MTLDNGVNDGSQIESQGQVTETQPAAPETGGAPPVNGTSPAQAFSQMGWDMPLEWEGTDGQVNQVKVGDLIESYMGYQQEQPYVQVGRLFEAASRGDARATQVLLGMLGPEPPARQMPPQPQTPQVPPEVTQRMDAYEQLLMDQTMRGVSSQLQSYIQNSKYNALKAEPRVVEAVQGQLLQMVRSGVMPRQEDVENLLSHWNRYYEDLAMKITQRSGNPGAFTVPPLGQGAAAPAQGMPRDVRWGSNPEVPDSRFRTYLLDKIRNLMADNLP